MGVYLFLGLMGGLCLGLIVAFVWHLSSQKAHRHTYEQLTADSQQTKVKLSALQAEYQLASNRLHEVLQLTEQQQATIEKLREQKQDLELQLGLKMSENKTLSEKLELQKQELEAMQKRLTTEFENIATRILKQHTDEFAQHNQKNLGEILSPLKEKIASFEKKVEETYEKELRDKLSLTEEVKKLTEINLQMSREANNLATALKGDPKKQGNWGEVILERVLERSGLKQGSEYQREEVLEGMAGQNIRPDVIVHLPDNKHIIIDSKVSLVAYERYISSSDEAQRKQELKAHIHSIRIHIQGLSEKNYQHARNINTPDFVLLFMPIEAAFALAVQNDTELFSFAWEKNIVIVSPTTLLATLRTIASIWKQENQTRNAQEIARLAGQLYDKLVGFTADMEKIKKSLDAADNAYSDAYRKLTSGNGNVMRTADKIKALGAKTTRQLPDNFQDN